MTNTDRPYITPTRQTAESPDESTYIVAVNDQGQHAVWPAELALPAGWRQQSAAMPKRAYVSQEISREYQISPSDRVLQLASLGFDTSVEQVLVTLICGAPTRRELRSLIWPHDSLRRAAR